MIIAGWILAILGLAQVVYSATIDVSQLIEGNRLLGIAPSVVANADLVAQRGMIHSAGCATFLAAAYLKPAPAGYQTKSWTSIGAVAAGSLALVGAGGFGAFVYFLHQKNADQRLVDEIRLKTAREESTEQLWAEADRRVKNEAEAREAAAASAP